MTLRLLAVLALATLAMLVTGVGLVLFSLAPPERVPTGLHLEEVYPYVALQIVLGTVGAAIALRHPANPIGWLLSAAALGSSLMHLLGGYATYGSLSERGLPYADVVAWGYSLGGLVIFLFLMPVLFVFPDGQLRSRREKLGLATGVAAFALLMGALALRSGPLLGILFVQNPFGWSEGERILDLAMVLGSAGAAAALVLAARSLRERSRRATERERLQLRWLYGGLGLYLVGTVLLVPAIFAELLGIPTDATIRYVVRLAGALSDTIFPIAIGIAILRHRLYDIDVLINRTLVYGATTATLLGLYAVIVLVALALLRPLTQGSELAVAVSTLAVASLIQPVRRRIQRGVDRRFYRSRYDAARTLDAFGTRLRDEVDIDALRHELVAVVRDTMEPAHASVWLREARR